MKHMTEVHTVGRPLPTWTYRGTHCWSTPTHVDLQRYTLLVNPRGPTEVHTVGRPYPRGPTEVHTVGRPLPTWTYRGTHCWSTPTHVDLQRYTLLVDPYPRGPTEVHTVGRPLPTWTYRGTHCWSTPTHVDLQRYTLLVDPYPRGPTEVHTVGRPLPTWTFLRRRTSRSQKGASPPPDHTQLTRDKRDSNVIENSGEHRRFHPITQIMWAFSRRNSENPVDSDTPRGVDFTQRPQAQIKP